MLGPFKECHSCQCLVFLVDKDFNEMADLRSLWRDSKQDIVASSQERSRVLSVACPCSKRRTTKSGI